MNKKIKEIYSTLHEQITGVKPAPEFIGSVSTLVIMLIIGTLFYSHVEGWSYVDAFYFSTITLATVGYGDLHPTTDVSKLFTIGYIFLGVGLGVYIFTSLAKNLMEGRKSRMDKLERMMKKLL